MNGILAFSFLLLLTMLPMALHAQPEGYYDNADASSPQALRNTLHAIIDDHERIPYTASETDTWDVLEQADADRDEPNRIVTLYRNISYPKQGGGNAFYNREHSWPKSYGYPDDDPNDPWDNYPYTDMHALFLSDADYNFYRSNSPYNECGAACTEYPSVANDGRGGRGGEDSNWQTGEYTEGRWDVWRGRRGDVARALMYMDLRYEGGVHGVTGAVEPDLVLTDDLSLIRDHQTQVNSDLAYMGMLSVLLDWHRQDPVDAAEVQHHETVAAYQGNRNPFIDHPEWVDCVFGGSCETMRINAGLSDAWFNPATSGQGFLVVVWEESQYMFVAWFTYDAERPPADVQAILGEPGHRWLTAQGTYSGDTAVLDIFTTSGGVFDAAEPAVGDSVKDGTLKIHFADCNAATATYDMPRAGLSGVVPLQRIVTDNVTLCETLKQPPEAE